MSAIENLVFASNHTFEEDETRNGGTNGSNGGIVHIRVQQRNGKKSLTTVEGLADDLDLAKIVKVLKKTLNTNGTVLDDEEFGLVLKLQGDQRKAVANFLSTYRICQPQEIKIHGF